MRDMVQVRRGKQHQFKGPDVRIGRSQFNRSHGVKMTFNASRLYPILCDEVLPGDTFTCRLNGFARIFSPLKVPVMDNITMETFFFFVPNRILWTNWVSMQGEHDGSGAQDTDYTVPIVNDLTVDHDSAVDGDGLAAYLGMPHGLDTSVIGVSALPFRAYMRIWNEWFRDQAIKAEKAMYVDDGPDAKVDYAIQLSNKRHDYFTTCLPYLQKGTAQTVSLSGIIDVKTAAAAGENLSVYTTALLAYQNWDAGASLVDLSVTEDADGSEKLFVDVSGGTVDINALRQSVAIQRLLERDARGGTRYVESIKAHFDVTSPDFRLQRPEYLGGGKSMINVHPVANTSDTAGANQGELAGVGTGVISGHAWAKSFTEHGWVIGLLRARGDLTYFQGLERQFSRSTRYDFYIPALAMLGEQSVLNKEIWVSNVANTDNAVFGYQERWSEYRTKHSRIVGTFNPDVSGAISQYHLAEDFSTLPALNNAFLQDSTPMSRIQTVTTEDDFLLDLWFDYKCARPLPVFSVPSLTGRF